jgi:hypothetical protein
MKKLLPMVLISLFLTSACAVTKGTRTERHIANPTTLDSTVVLVVHEEYEETTTYPWAIAFGIIGGIGAVMYILEKR